MKRVPHGDRLEPARRDPGQLERHANRRRAAGREEHATEITGCQVDQAPGQVHRRLARVATRAEREFVELLFDGFDDARMTEPDLMHIVAMEVQQLAALCVRDRRADCPAQRIQAGRGKRLMKKQFGILGQQFTRGGVEVSGLPGRAGRRGVDVAFGVEAGMGW